MCLNKTQLKNFRRKKNTLSFVYCKKIENFGGFGIGKFGNSEIFLRLVNSKEIVLFEEVGNFQSIWIFDFGSYTEIENSENSEIFPRYVNFKECVLLEEVENFRGFWVFDFIP